MFAPASMTLAACLQISTGPIDGGGAGATTGPSSPATSSDGGGTGCSETPSGLLVLCETIDACPGVGVDPVVFAGCGFRLAGPDPIDLECVCGDLLCPIGAPGTCAAASSLLAAQTVLGVCAQAGQGLCVPLVATESDAGSSSTCTPACESQCSGAPDCLQACGC
jgi:hypothetical protein